MEANTPLPAASLFGVMTGTLDGLIGHIVCNEVPSLFRPHSALYATCSCAGRWVYLLLDPWQLPSRVLVVGRNFRDRRHASGHRPLEPAPARATQ